MASNSKNLAELLNSDVTLTATDIANDAVTTAKIADGAITPAKTAGLGGVSKNLLINGGFTIAQRAEARTSSDGNNEGYATVDRWSFRWNNGIPGVATVSQETSGDRPAGFGSFFKVNMATANNSMRSGTSDWVYLYQPIEAQNLQKLEYGTSGAKKLTLSFYAKRVGTWGQSQNISVGLQTQDGTQEFINASVTTQTTWTRHTVTFDGSQTATINNDNGAGLNLYISLAGSQTGTYTGAASTSWSTTRQDFDNQIGNLLSNTANEFHITGLQLEIGDVATDFEHRSVAEELALCQRYCCDLTPTATGSPYITGSGAAATSGIAVAHVAFPQQMRTTPSIVTAAASNYRVYNGSTLTCSNVAANGLSPVGGGINFTTGSGMSVGQAVGVYTNGTGHRTLMVAEL
jgi:hypothetical protein